jgi:hypothetical protein
MGLLVHMGGSGGLTTTHADFICCCKTGRCKSLFSNTTIIIQTFLSHLHVHYSTHSSNRKIFYPNQCLHSLSRCHDSHIRHPCRDKMCSSELLTTLKLLACALPLSQSLGLLQPSFSAQTPISRIILRTASERLLWHCFTILAI